MRPRRGLSRTVATAAAAGLAVAVAGCGSSRPASRASAVTHFPYLGSRPTAPRLPAGLPDGSAVVVSMDDRGYVRPASLRLASDATFQSTGWTAWGTTRATGHGTATVRICTPNCGAGHNARYRATVELTGLRSCGSYRLYENAQIMLDTVKGTRPWGAYLRDACG